MRLRDSVVLVRSGQDEADGVTVPAQLHYTGASVSADGSSVVLADRARVIVKALPIQPAAVYWHGIRYELAGPPMPRTKGSTVHHYTIPLQRST